MNSSKGVQIGGKYPNISNFFEPVFELFMNSSKKVEQFMNSSKSESLLRIRAEHIFLRRQPQFFFFGFQEHGRQGYLDDFRREKKSIHHRHIDDFRNEKNVITYVGGGLYVTHGDGFSSLFFSLIT